MPICLTPCKLPDFDSGRMVQVLRRGVSGPTLIRLLARLTDADVSESRQPLSDRLSLWLGWTDAIALSTVLEGGPLAVTANPKSLDSAEMREYDRMRAALTYAIADEKAYTADVFVPTQRGAPRTAPVSPDEALLEYTIYRKRYQTIQQAMETSIAKLRGSLRAVLAAQTPDRARLAMVDAILERSLSLQERRLLATVPGLLEKHFKRLRQAAQKAEKEAQERAAKAAEAETAASAGPAADPVTNVAQADSVGSSRSEGTQSAGEPVPQTSASQASAAKNIASSRFAAATATTAEAAATTSPAVQPTTRAVPLANTRYTANRANKPAAPVVPLWLSTFRKDMRSVLLAELDIRLQPIEGLLAALRAS
ncbi:hypothetical protein GCM10027287_08590 [Bordetella muralis]